MASLVPPNAPPPFQPGDRVTYWTRKAGEIRSTLVVADIVELSEDGTMARVIRPDAVAPYREVEVRRLRRVTHARSVEGT